MILVLALGSAPAAWTQVSPNGPELQVNTYTTGSQSAPALAAGGQGSFVVVWQSYGSNGTDTSDTSVQARRFAADGTALGPEFQVNSYTMSRQRSPEVAADASGRSVVVWDSQGSSGTDSSSLSVQAQRYDASGTALGSEFQVNTYTTGWQEAADVAVDAQGNFVVVWQSYGSSGTDTSDTSVQARRFAADGTALGPEFQVNTYTTNYQFAGCVGMDSDGNFVVAWTSFGSAGTDTSDFSVQARRYAADGMPLGGQFQVNTYTTGWQIGGSVAMDPVGNFIISWNSLGSSGTDTDGWSAQARRYAADGSPLGDEFQLNTYTTGSQRSPSVALDPIGNFVAAWMSEGSSGTDTSDGSIQARLYDADGAPRGGQFQVNTYTTSWQEAARVAVDDQGNFVVAWHSFGSYGTDTDTSVHAQRFDGLFRDGFETGDLLRWSSAVP